MYGRVLSTKKVKSQASTALTFAESFLEAFSVDMPEDVMRLPVEVSECQLAEQLIAATEDITCQYTTNGKIRFSHSGSVSAWRVLPVVQVARKHGDCFFFLQVATQTWTEQ